MPKKSSEEKKLWCRVTYFLIKKFKSITIIFILRYQTIRENKYEIHATYLQIGADRIIIKSNYKYLFIKFNSNVYLKNISKKENRSFIISA